EHTTGLVQPSPGTKVRVRWANSACSILASAEARFLQIAHDYTFLNPHLSLSVNWFGKGSRVEATAPAWKKWLPSNPTSPHWYTQENSERLLPASIAHDQDAGHPRTAREVVAEFRGLTASAKQKAVLADLGLSRTGLAELVEGDVLRSELIARLLAAMKEQSR